MTQKIFLIILAGAFGGALRGVMGIAKNAVNKKDLQINWNWFFLSLVVSAVVGILAATFFGEDLRLAVLAGYAGSDFIEGLIKLKIKEKINEPEAQD